MQVTAELLTALISQQSAQYHMLSESNYKDARATNAETPHATYAATRHATKQERHTPRHAPMPPRVVQNQADGNVKNIMAS